VNYFFYQLTRSVGVFFRTFRAFLARRVVAIGSRIRRLTNFSRHATKAASSSLQGVVSAAQKPTSREDYVETGRLYISKALIIKILMTLVAMGVIFYFIVWPFVLSHFLTAKFYEKDKRVADWSGRVIVFSDEKKKVPLFSGRLEDGVLQGEGKQYDESGILLYEGQFRDGIRSGNGTEYADGILAYEGQFTDGRYEGRGRLYEDGLLTYEGQFSGGLRSGSGTEYQNGVIVYEGQFLEDVHDGRGKLYKDGTLSYDGDFRAGSEEGNGISYYGSGRMSYQGQFLAGLPDGMGIAYGTDGRKAYEGEFTEGKYNGAGTEFFSDGGQLTATFAEGTPEGTVTWKKNGILYYQGEWTDGMPAGFGALFNKAGKTIYEGPFLGGTVDGGKLLEMTTEELRTVLGDGNVRTDDASGVFQLTATELGLAAQCTFQTEDRESMVHKLYLTQPEGAEWVTLLPGMDYTTPIAWPDGMMANKGTTNYTQQNGVNLRSGTYASEDAIANGRRITVLYGDEARTEALLVAWSKMENTPAAPGSDAVNVSDSRIEGLLGALDLMDDTAGASSGGAGASSGGKSPDKAFAKCEDAAQAVTLADAMLDCWAQMERKSALEENLERVGVMLADANDALGKGKGSAEAVAALEALQLSLANQIDACTTAIKRAELRAQDVGAEKLSDYALDDMLINFDPSKQKIGELSLVAAAYAQATGQSGRTAEETETAVKTALLDLTDAHSAVEVCLAQYQAAEQSVQRAAGEYATGSGTKEAWYQAMNNQALARESLVSALADFSREANAFNQMTGGWVSRTFGWHEDIFEPLFQAAILPEEPAEEAAEEPADEPAEAAGGV